MSENNLNNNTQNENSNNSETTVSELNKFMTKEMEMNLPYDNSSIHTSPEAINMFNKNISKENLKDLTTYIVDGVEVLPNEEKLLVIDASLKQRGNVPITASYNNTQYRPAIAKTDVGKWDKTIWIKGGYKITQDTTTLPTIIESRLENDLGQQSVEGNRVFRSNVYVPFDIEGTLSLENVDRVCKTGEVILESEYAYSSPKSDFSDDKIQIVIVDYEDYENTSIRFFLNKQDPETIFTISETNASDAIAAIGRYARTIGSLQTSAPKHTIYFIVLSNVKNPLRCARCVVNINDNLIGNDFGKFRFGSVRQIAAATGKCLNYIQNYVQYEYNYLEVNGDTYIQHAGCKTFSQVNNTAFTDYAAWNALTGNALTWPTTDCTMPCSRQKWNIQDYYTALHYLVEYHYKIATPYTTGSSSNPEASDWNLLKFSSDNYGYVTVPISDYICRVALDKKLCTPVLDETHFIEHRGILGNKLKILANYRAGALLDCISSVFGSLFNMLKIVDLEMVSYINEIIDAQTCGILKLGSKNADNNEEHLLGMLGHFKFYPSNPDLIMTNARGSRAITGFTQVADPTNDDLVYEEYWPISTYWRSDTFGLPACDELEFEVNYYDNNNAIGWREMDDKQYYVSHDNFKCQIKYQLDPLQDPKSANLIYNSYVFLSNGKTDSAGMFRKFGLLNTDAFTDVIFRPGTYTSVSATSHSYPICYGHRWYTPKLQTERSSNLRSKLFG